MLKVNPAVTMVANISLNDIGMNRKYVRKMEYITEQPVLEF